MNVTRRRPTISSAILVSALFGVLVFAGTAFAGSLGDEAARAISREGSELGAGARITALSEALRPPARQEAALVVASRGTDPVSTADLPASPAKATAAVRLDFGSLDAMPQATGDAQWKCLAQAIYFEARGEPLEGQIAVAEVVLNRVDNSRFPSSVCGVTRQGVGSGGGCQFSYACDRNSDVMKSADARQRSEKLAALMLAGRARTVTGGATYFHTRSIRPDWARRFTRTATIGHHLFYRNGSYQVAGG